VRFYRKCISRYFAKSVFFRKCVFAILPEVSLLQQLSSPEVEGVTNVADRRVAVQHLGVLLYALKNDNITNAE
jgi:hypothetical protein